MIGSAEPLPYATAASHPEAQSHVGWYLQCYLAGAWTDVYYFNRSVVLQSVINACAEASFRGHPLFTRRLVVTMPLLDGRMTLADFTLKIRRQGEPTERRELGSEEERDAVLAEVFGINMDAAVNC